MILAEGRFEAEAASVACSHTPHPPVQQDHADREARSAAVDDREARSAAVIDPLLWRDVMHALLAMLESVRDKNRALLIEA